MRDWDDYGTSVVGILSCQNVSVISSETKTTPEYRLEDDYMLMIGISCFFVAAIMMIMEIGCYAFGIILFIILLLAVIPRLR